MPHAQIPTIAGWMSKEKLTLEPEVGILEGIAALVKHGVTAAPVVDDDQRLLGILTVTDCLRVVAAASYGGEVQGGTVGSFMSPVAVELSPAMDLFQAVDRFLTCHVQTLPVVEDGRLLGSITRHHLLRAIQDFAARQLDEKHKVVERARGAENRPKGIEAMQQAAAKQSPRSLARLFSRNR